ncbi:hypothetical protein GCM10027194_35260 [Thalassiella azotivora]
MAAAVDVDAVDHLPLILLTPINGAMVSNGNPALGWEWTVAFTVLGSGRADTSDLADELYQAVHGLHDDGAAVPGVGEVSSVEDVAMPTRTATSTVNAQDLTQFDGTFLIRVRPPRS